MRDGNGIGKPQRRLDLANEEERHDDRKRGSETQKLIPTARRASSFVRLGLAGGSGS
jgi:hypothetical protein